MKLTIKKRFGGNWVHVRGGRVLRLAQAHEVSVNGYNDAPDTAPRELTGDGLVPHRARTFDGPTVTACVGDIAVEVIRRWDHKVVGWAYYTGGVINIVEYAKDLVALPSRFEVVPGHVTDVSPTMTTQWETYVEAMQRMALGPAPLTCSKIDVADNHELEQACLALAKAYGASSDPSATGHLLASVSSQRAMGKRGTRALLHLQPAVHASEYAAQPFFHDLLASSTALVETPFLLTN